MINTVDECVDAWKGVDWPSTQHQVQSALVSFSESSQNIILSRKALVEQSREVKNNKSEDALLDLVKTLQKNVDDLIFKCKEREEGFASLANFIINTPNPAEIIFDWQAKKERILSLQMTVQELQVENEKYGKIAVDILNQERQLKDEELRQAQATVQKLTFQLEERNAAKLTATSDRASIELEKAKFKIEEVLQENKTLKNSMGDVTKAFQQVQLLKNELDETRKQLVQTHKNMHTEPPVKLFAEVTALKEALQRETNEKHRIETDNLRLMEKIRLLNARRSISEAESGDFNINAFKSVTLSSIVTTAFVNGSMTKKFISFYILLLHVILLYKIFL